MKKVFFLFLFVLTVAVFVSEVSAAEPPTLREDFNNLDDWEPVVFSKINRRSEYEIREEDSNRVLMASSNASASGIMWKKAFSVTEYPHLKWRWKVMNTYKKADPGSKEGDDYPMRVYVIFESPSPHDSFWQKIGKNITRSLTGVDPDLTCLMFVWSGTAVKETVFSSPYSDRIRIIVLRSGNAGLGTWQEESVDIPRVYRDVFREGPPETAKIAVMNDSDNTGGKSVSYLDYIELRR